MPRPRRPRIAILDFGSQYTHLLSRRIRSLGVYTEILPPDVPRHRLRDVQGIVLSGGPQSVTDERIRVDAGVFTLGIPVLGICYGHQLMAHLLGGAVRPGTTREYGVAQLRRSAASSRLFRSLDATETVWMSHGDSVVRMPTGFVRIGKTATCPVAAMADPGRRLYGLQFHPEVTHTLHGSRMLRAFVRNICGVRTTSWTMAHELPRLLSVVRHAVGSRRVLLLNSGGVDSAVAYALIARAIGVRRVVAVYVDTGFMREGETAGVVRQFAQLGLPLMVEDASQRFTRALRTVTDPEEKRRRIGALYVDVRRRMQRRLGFARHWMLAQGTIYPDTIESGGTTHSATIKTHHNRVPEIEALRRRGQVLEPLAELYKDDVRTLGRILGLPRGLVQRHPFPGPGLAIRILCAARSRRRLATPSRLAREVRRISRTVVPVVIPVQSVGVQGDQRTYAHPVALLGVRTWASCDRLAPQLPNTSPLVNRVLRLVGGSVRRMPRAVLQRAMLTPNRVALLRKADAVVRDFLRRTGLASSIWQFPVVLLPYGTGGRETIILRPVESREAMTVHYYRMPEGRLRHLTAELLRLPGIEFVLYDVTNKPPGTIEWE
ncbi:MAG: glutamine-hydrolyzing GMP synthase [Candidatus Kerfeldbacteria bacterium]|nr:glutamine-hydrolyzing GMP synthase [Candidatus Kerfeldbacteria bacterium]